MSIELDSLSSSPSIRVKLGLHILSFVAPRLLNDGIFIGERIAIAYTWYKFLCKVSRCPPVSEDPEKWSLVELRVIGEWLVDYARSLLRDFVST